MFYRLRCPAPPNSNEGVAGSPPGFDRKLLTRGFG